MTVTDLKPGKHNLTYLFLDGEFALSVYPDLLYEHHIRKGSVLDTAALSSLTDAQHTLYARNRALSILSAGDCSEKMLYDKLVGRGIEEEYAASAVAYCVEKGFADDARLLPRFLKHYFETKGYGIMRVRQTLVQKGFSRVMIDEALAEYEPDTLSVIEQYLQKEPREKLNDRKECSRIIQKLMRKGFLYGDVRAALSHYTEFDPEDTDD
jgi:regulatory protein